MACLPDHKILDYLDGEGKSIEQAMIRDHLLVCPACRRTTDRYMELQQILSQPPAVEPPAGLIPQIMKKLYPQTPRYTSIAALIAASFIFFVTWIYIYFDFSSNSLIQALRLTTDGTSGWLANIIKAITAVYNGAQAATKAGSAVLRMLLPTPLGAIAAVLALLAVSALLANFLLRPLFRKARTRKT